ncbi:uncharacterized protein LOC131658773 [Vicia villosa]|uniref:uncharacterized protein LOC131658773 n=1 Tax=Vicia villosa TaxID=3911 RepID=UPI00273C30F8|nr:uncharacterized protein LOC131658773 [Vicia villosa]
MKKDESSSHRKFTKNYDICNLFIGFVTSYVKNLLKGVEEITKMKQKHKWSDQLLNRFMEKPFESYLGAGCKPTGHVTETDFVDAYKPNQGKNNSEEKRLQEVLDSDTAILTAARNGIVEIVDVLLRQIPSSIYEVNLESKNVLLVAIENRRPNVVEALLKWVQENNKMRIFHNLIQSRDMQENTVTFSCKNK